MMIQRPIESLPITSASVSGDGRSHGGGGGTRSTMITALPDIPGAAIGVRLRTVTKIAGSYYGHENTMAQCPHHTAGLERDDGTT